MDESAILLKVELYYRSWSLWLSFQCHCLTSQGKQQDITLSPAKDAWNTSESNSESLLVRLCNSQGPLHSKRYDNETALDCALIYKDEICKVYKRQT